MACYASKFPRSIPKIKLAAILCSLLELWQTYQASGSQTFPNVLVSRPTQPLQWVATLCSLILEQSHTRSPYQDTPDPQPTPLASASQCMQKQPRSKLEGYGYKQEIWSLKAFLGHGPNVSWKQPLEAPNKALQQRAQGYNPSHIRLQPIIWEMLSQECPTPNSI